MSYVQAHQCGQVSYVQAYQGGEVSFVQVHQGGEVSNVKEFARFILLKTKSLLLKIVAH